MKMKIGIFAYNFEHKKTQEGLLNLFLHGYKVECILAANPVELNFYQSKIRLTPKDLRYIHPQIIAKRLKIPYHVVAHNSQESKDLIKNYNLDVGIILGARILKKDIIDTFKIGIINLHPGLLPENRGLDTIKWAILKDFKQGATAHFINETIDQGRIIIKKNIKIFNDDTLIDLYLRIQNLEQELMLESLKIIENANNNFEKISSETGSFKAVPPELEKKLFVQFEKYKKKISVKS